MDTGKRILVVDDTPQNIEILIGLLGSQYDILVSTGGKEALEIADNERPDLILLDIMMPDMDGYEVCQRLKNNRSTRDIPVIFITAKTDEDSIEKAYDTGGADYVTKPIKQKELLARIKTHLDMKSLINNLEESHKELKLLAQIGEMIGNIAHQWKQPLSLISVMMINIKLAHELGVTSKKDIDSYSNNVIDLVQYLSETVDVFRNFLKEKKVLKELVIKDEINKSLSIVEAILKDNHIDCIKDISQSKSLKHTMVAGELVQVLINLINNAKDILKERGVKSPWVKIILEDIDSRAIITVEDNGGGIPDNIIEKIFDPYFTTKNQNQGTGLGLHMSHQIVTDSLNGELYVNNTENGAKFFIELPLLNSKN